MSCSDQYVLGKKSPKAAWCITLNVLYMHRRNRDGMLYRVLKVLLKICLSGTFIGITIRERERQIKRNKYKKRKRNEEKEA